MKRISFIMVVVYVAVLGLPVKAQQPNANYYLTGDTIYGRSPIYYYYDWWPDTWLADTSHRLALSGFYSNNFEVIDIGVSFATVGLCSQLIWGELNMYYYTDRPLKIMGIATASKVDAPQHLSINYDFGAPFYQDYFRLYEAKSDTFQLMAEVPWRIDVPWRYMYLDLRSVRGLGVWLTANPGDNLLLDACCGDTPNYFSAVVPIQEYYFDSMITVTDSFYIGQTSHILGYNTSHNSIYYSDRYDTTNMHNNGLCVQCPALAFDSLSYCSRYYQGCPGKNDCESVPTHLYKYRNIQWANPYDATDTIDRDWHWDYGYGYWLNFPIIYVDSLYNPRFDCPAVENFRLEQMDSIRALFMWDANSDQDSWQLSYGLSGTLPDDGTIVNCPIQVGQIMGLDSGVHYDVYVRAVCNRDSTMYSDWSGPLDVCWTDTTGGTTPGEVGVVSMLDALTYIVPNPASEYIQVMSSFRMSKVEVYNINGRKMLDKGVGDISTSFSVHDWPSDVYIIIIHTPVGNVAKKLVVR